MSGIASVIQNFRKQQIQVSQIKDEAAKDREARLARQREMKAKRRESEAKKAHQADSNSSAPSTSTAQASTSLHADLFRGSLSPQAPLGLRQKAVVDYLQKEAAPRTVAELDAALDCRLEEDTSLMRELRRNEKVGIDDDGRFFYQPEINVKSKAALLQKVQVADKPVLMRSIIEAYPKAEQDVQALKAEGLVVGFQSFEAEIMGEVLFPVDQRLVGFHVDQAIVDLWQQTAIPETEDDLIAAVQAAGFKPAPRKAVRKREKAERKKKVRKQSKLRSVTNVHLMHLLDGEAPVTID